MQANFLKSIIEELIDRQATPIVDLLAGKKDVNEFLVAKKMGLTINQTRNILYKLSDYGLVSFVRKKDKRKGWYIYYWTLKVHKSLSLLERKLKEELEKAEKALDKRRNERFYICKTCEIEVDEETALMQNFMCPECEEVYELQDNSKIVRKLEKKAKKLREDLDMVKEERIKEGKRLEKKRVKRVKIKEAVKKAKRTRKRRKTMRKKREAKGVEEKKKGKKKRSSLKSKASKGGKKTGKKKKGKTEKKIKKGKAVNKSKKAKGRKKSKKSRTRKKSKSGKRKGGKKSGKSKKKKKTGKKTKKKTGKKSGKSKKKTKKKSGKKKRG